MQGKLQQAGVAFFALWLLSFSNVAFAQMSHAHDSTSVRGARLTFGAMALGVLTRAAPAFDSKTYTELQLVQPVVSANAAWRRISFVGMLNAEGYTLKRGELNAGIYGEGYVDRRHPHTLVHEAMLTLAPAAIGTQTGKTSLAFSVSAGRGFVPFGSDDPMMRPLEKYPVNHHHAQILERVQGVLAARATLGEKSLALEAATFNGDEPAGPFHGPRWNRFGDSWSIRATATPLRDVEISLSEASVVSPELQQGGAFDHRQTHMSLRIDRDPLHPGNRYLLAEWARTDEQIDGTRAFRYHSMLLEAAQGWRGALVAARIERTDRAEQGRLTDPFRAAVGHVDFQILGVTQWTVGTVAVHAPPLRTGMLNARVVPFAEVSRAVPKPRTQPSAFDAAGFYGDDKVWTLSLGIRMHAGTMRHRMGRYGVMSANGTARAHSM